MGCKNSTRIKLVSVSTSGSKGVQLMKFQRGLTAPLGFSIHKRIEGGATVLKRLHRFKYVGFSIHKRIEGGATFRKSSLVLRSMSVSVSTSGSKGVQLFLTREIPSNSPTFQYPQADRRGCNRDDAGNVIGCRNRFSIHKRIEGGATECHRPLSNPKSGVSVSTSGSKGVQPAWFTLTARPVGEFQYPQADRRGCNCPSGGVESGVPEFQYPQADRRGCNLPKRGAGSDQRGGFSIHKRIEGGATSRCNPMSAP